ncbi:MAG: TPM domain-containing protein [Bdellovibrionaceae bacterium]|nr:TPM domain-containing protein [Pseudobdellovibrionaceae bacterium]
MLRPERRLRRAGFLLLAAVCGIALAVVARAAFEVPQLTGPVVDNADLLSSRAERTLESALRHLLARGGSQIQVLTVPTLAGVPIEQASIQVTDAWRLGGAKSDRGVLLMISREDRRMRIEVGQGNEGALTDAQSKRIIAESITPLFRSGDFEGGILVGVFEIARATDPEIDLKPYLEGTGRRPQGGARPRLPLNGWIILVIFIWFVISQIARGGGGRGLRRRSGIYYGGGSRGGWGGGGGWSGGGGGGWSGGGGGFSGGGASGSW